VTAYATVTIVVSKPSRCSYSGHNGVGTVPNAICTVNAAVMNQNPVECDARTAGRVRIRFPVDDEAGAVAVIQRSSRTGGAPGRSGHTGENLDPGHLDTSFHTAIGDVVHLGTR
jgi:hypothetical protein